MNAPSASAPESLDPAADFFTLLGLPARYDVARDDVEAAYLERSKIWHPDRHAGADSATRRRAMEVSSALNDAYKTLRDRVRRAEYLCKLFGRDLDSSDRARGAPTMDETFLVEMIERRERLEAAEGEGALALEEFRSEAEAEADRCLEQGIRHLATGEVDLAARALVARRYVQRLLDEIDALEGEP